MGNSKSSAAMYGKAYPAGTTNQQSGEVEIKTLLFASGKKSKIGTAIDSI